MVAVVEERVSAILIWPALSAGITAVMLLIGGWRLIERGRVRIRRGNLRSRLFK